MVLVLFVWMLLFCCHDIGVKYTGKYKGLSVHFWHKEDNR